LAFLLKNTGLSQASGNLSRMWLFQRVLAIIFLVFMTVLCHSGVTSAPKGLSPDNEYEIVKIVYGGYGFGKTCDYPYVELNLTDGSFYQYAPQYTSLETREKKKLGTASGQDIAEVKTALGGDNMATVLPQVIAELNEATADMGPCGGPGTDMDIEYRDGTKDELHTGGCGMHFDRDIETVLGALDPLTRRFASTADDYCSLWTENPARPEPI